MASSPKGCSSSSWTWEQNKSFEVALAKYIKVDPPDRWQKIANPVGGISAEEVERQYRNLVEDVQRIDAGQVP
ncbi:hypothetical protein C5167_047952 [Papaver somniferum]|uniref:Myb-like domain-containing protein n=1 Tax=Papaver somniferum TaxID=3469 RepID=A0A4Y7KGI1_PAPSO|nr:hypothetical protein C5167_047952 [Papaver somniferum]